MRQRIKRFLEEHTLFAWFTSLALVVLTTADMRWDVSRGNQPSLSLILFGVVALTVFSTLSLYVQNKYKNKLHERWQGAFFQRSLTCAIAGVLIVCFRLLLAMTFGMIESPILAGITIGGCILMLVGGLGVAYHVLKTELEGSP
jgi:hypothetical protein